MWTIREEATRSTHGTKDKQTGLQPRVPAAEAGRLPGGGGT